MSSATNPPIQRPKKSVACNQPMDRVSQIILLNNFICSAPVDGVVPHGPHLQLHLFVPAAATSTCGKQLPMLTMEANVRRIFIKMPLLKMMFAASMALQVTLVRLVYKQILSEELSSFLGGMLHQWCLGDGL